MNGVRDSRTPTMLDESVAARQKAILDGLLACLLCRGRLKHDTDRYECLSCGKGYPVRNGVPRFVGDLSDDAQQVRQSFDLEHTKYLDSRHLHFTPQLAEQWLADVRLPRDYFQGKLVLDAGCGSGRWTYALTSLGATVVAVDFTDAGVAVTRKATEAIDHVAVLQADLAHLPFNPGIFDFVVSWGVLHHTPDTKTAFGRLVPLVRKGGQLYVMVYERHNPVKFMLTDCLRWVLRQFPCEKRYELCRHLMIKSRRLYSFLAHRIICAPYPQSADPLEITTVQLGLYDTYAPAFNHLHTREEVVDWFRQHNFEAITLTRPIRFTQKKFIKLLGECGGSINIRGVRT